MLDLLAKDDSSELAALTADLRKRTDRARELLAQQGIEIRVTAPPAKPAQPKDAATISFRKQIAPLLVSKCGGCHVQRSRGEFSMATYAALQKGSPDGAVVMPGDASGSRMVELIEAGDMPRGGGKISPDELQLLVTWINEGAKYDGDDPAQPLRSLAPPDPNATTERLAVVQAKGDEGVLFARDLGPVLIEHCLACHGDQNPSNGLSLYTFQRMLSGGNRGLPLVPAKPAESLLVKKLRGQADGEQMPRDKPPLPEETIAQFEKWIALGAKFDGADPAAPLEDVVALVVAMNATHDELTKSRAALAERNWRLILPDSQPEHMETAQVLVYGSVDRQLLDKVASVADEQAAAIAKLFKLPAGPLVKGRLTLYVFDKRYDYGEVGTMLERREIPAAWRGHWRYSGVDAYGCLLLESDDVPPGLVAQQIAGAYVASLGKVPPWFSEGTARAVAAKLDPRDGRVKTWDAAVARLLQTVDKPDAFLAGQLPPEEGDTLSYGFVKYLMTSADRFAGLLEALAQGTAFDAAFEASYRAKPADAAANWVSRATRRGR
ncbi:MAG: c-type cytochrome domain-containing protein [Pirellulales bacterium]